MRSGPSSPASRASPERTRATQHALLHTPEQHLSPPGQSPLPQHATQVPLPQSLEVPGHTQALPVQTLPPEHFLPQPPQWFGSLVVSAQKLVHSVKADGHAGTQTLFAQLVVPPVGAVQTLVQLPQWFLSVFRSKQSSPHFVNPLLQVTVQLPLLHTGEPCPLGGPGHCWQVEPQWLASVSVAKHVEAVPHRE